MIAKDKIKIKSEIKEKEVNFCIKTAISQNGFKQKKKNPKSSAFVQVLDNL